MVLFPDQFHTEELPEEIPRDFTLYRKNARGTYQIWYMNIEYDKSEGGYYLAGYHGVEGGRLIPTLRKVTPKNVGKINETSQYEQAVIERRAWYVEKLKKYNISKTEKVFSPMLAEPYDKRHISSFPVYVQRKYDGTRAYAYKDGSGKVRMFSRSGDEKVVRQRESLEKIFDGTRSYSIVLDGELYTHEIPLQDIAAKLALGEQLDYYVYDAYFPNTPNAQYEERKGVLEELIKGTDIREVETVKVQNYEEIDRFVEKVTAEGYEGAIVRLPKGKYELKRSKSILKYKKIETGDCIIKSVRAADNDPYRVIFTVRDLESTQKEFDISGIGDRKQYQKKILDDPDSYVGKGFRYKFYDRTREGKPKYAYPVGDGKIEFVDPIVFDKKID